MNSCGSGFVLLTYVFLMQPAAVFGELNFGGGKGFDFSRFDDHLSKIKDVVTDAAEKVSQAAPEDVADAVHAVAKEKLQEVKTIITEMKNKTSPEELTEALKTANSPDIADAIKSTAAAVSQGMEAVQNTSAEELRDKIASVQQVTTDHLLKQIGSNETEDLVKTIEQIHEKAVDLVDEQGEKVARTITENAPEAAHFLAHGSHTDSYEEDHRMYRDKPVPATLYIVLAAATAAAFTGGFIAFRTYKSKDSRSLSVLLADADNEMSMSGSIRPDDSQEAVFQSF